MIPAAARSELVGVEALDVPLQNLPSQSTSWVLFVIASQLLEASRV